MIEATVRDMTLNLACGCARPVPRVGSRSAADAPMRPLMRRLSPRAPPAAGLLLAPAAAHAATPGVNIVGSDPARWRSGQPPAPSTVRMFAPCAAASRRPIATYKNIASYAAGPAAWASSSSSIGNRDGSATPTRSGGLRELRRGDFAAQMQRVRAAPPPTRSGTRRTRPTSGAPRSTRRTTPRSCKAAYPRIKAGRPGREGAARTADRQQLQLPRARSTPPGAGSLVRRRRGPHRHGVPRRSAELLLSRGRQGRAVHLPRLPHRPRRHGRQRRRRQADLDDRAGLDHHDDHLRAWHVGRARSRRASPRPRRRPTSRRPTTAWPPIPTSRPRCGSRSRTPPATATSSTTTACSAPTARTSRPWDAFQSVVTRGRQAHRRRAATSTPPSLTISSPATSEQYVQTLTISAVATDPSSVARMTFQADGKEIRNFTGADVGLRQGREARLAGREEPRLRARTRSPSSRSTRRATRSPRASR